VFVRGKGRGVGTKEASVLYFVREP